MVFRLWKFKIPEVSALMHLLIAPTLQTIFDWANSFGKASSLRGFQPFLEKWLSADNSGKELCPHFLEQV